MLWAKLDGPAQQAEISRQWRAWDYAQANDRQIRDADPEQDQVTDAASLLDRDPDRAFFLLLTLAQQGSVWAMVNLGWCCAVGCGAPTNATDAEYWYKRAYDAGCDRALLDYAGMLERRGALHLAQEVYAAGAARGWAPAIFHAVRLDLRDAKTLEARLRQKPNLERAAALGSPAALFLLTKYMVRGRFGVRNVAGGLRLLYGQLKKTLAGDEQGEERPAKLETAPPGVTLQ